jgi:hypothetical protein
MPFQIKLILMTEVILIHHDLPDCLRTHVSTSPRSGSSTLIELPSHSCSGATDGKGISRYATESRINVPILGPPIQCRLNLRLNPRFEKYKRYFYVDIGHVLRRSLRLNVINELLEKSPNTSAYRRWMLTQRIEICQGDDTRSYNDRDIRIDIFFRRHRRSTFSVCLAETMSIS